MTITIEMNQKIQNLQIIYIYIYIYIHIHTNSDVKISKMPKIYI